MTRGVGRVFPVAHTASCPWRPSSSAPHIRKRTRGASSIHDDSSPRRRASLRPARANGGHTRAAWVRVREASRIFAKPLTPHRRSPRQRPPPERDG
eukprot:scaffold51_cov401-Prasinococcus_capsulatus_cf.AAC.34